MNTGSIQRAKQLIQLAQDNSPEEFVRLIPFPFLVAMGSEFTERGDYMTKAETRIKTHERLEASQQLDPNARVFEVKKRPGLNDTPDRIVIGRSTVSDIQLYNAEISKVHAYITWIDSPDGKKFQILDGDSRNGTWIKRIRLSPHNPRLLESGETIRFGASVFLGFYCPADLHSRILAGAV